MRKITSHSVCGMLFLGILVFSSNPAQAEPVNHPGNCGPFTGDIYACRGTLICTADGDYMCCTNNGHGGQDCEQVEAKAINSGAMRMPGGNVKVAPVNPPPNAARFPNAGMNAPVMRRGVEGEQQPAEQAPSTSTTSEQPNQEKPQ